jgi:hypothetical protein
MRLADAATSGELRLGGAKQTVGDPKPSRNLNLTPPPSPLILSMAISPVQTPRFEPSLSQPLHHRVGKHVGGEYQCDAIQSVQPSPLPGK